jgi:EXS family
MLHISASDNFNWQLAFQLFRWTLLVVLFTFLSAVNLAGWKNSRINPVLLLELNPRDNLSYHQLFAVNRLVIS